jgi:hypothetical protein
LVENARRRRQLARFAIQRDIGEITGRELAAQDVAGKGRSIASAGRASAAAKISEMDRIMQPS